MPTRLMEADYEALKEMVCGIHEEAARRGISLHFIDAKGVIIEKKPDGTLIPFKDFSSISTEE